jgi:hypothetical protein
MIKAYFNETFTRVRYIKNNIGKVVTTNVLVLRGRFEDNRQVLANGEGEQVLSKARIFTTFGADIQEGDRVFLGTTTETGTTGTQTGEIRIPKSIQTYPVLRAGNMKGFGQSHKELILG